MRVVVEEKCEFVKTTPERSLFFVTMELREAFGRAQLIRIPVP